MSSRPYPTSISAIAAVLLAVSAVLAPPLARAASAQATDYLIGPQDVLTVTVWDAPEASGKFPVEADGTFSFPMIGRLKASGLSLREVEEDLTKRLKDGYFKDPKVSVAVEHYRSQRIFVVGEVNTPGTYPLTGEMTLIEAFARAGGLASRDVAGYVVLVRASSGSAKPADSASEATAEVQQVDLKELETGGATSRLALRDGDTIFVPRAGSVYVFGQVKSPGFYTIQRDTTVLQALSLAGGVSERGSTSRIRIMRLVNGKKTEVRASLDDPVQAGDTIVVLERYF